MYIIIIMSFFGAFSQSGNLYDVYALDILNDNTKDL